MYSYDTFLVEHSFVRRVRSIHSSLSHSSRRRIRPHARDRLVDVIPKAQVANERRYWLAEQRHTEKNLRRAQQPHRHETKFAGNCIVPSQRECGVALLSELM